MTASRRPSWRRWLIAAAALAAGGLLLVPVTTRQGVNFTVSVHQVPLYLKALSFIDRHYQYHYLARQITQGISSDRERVLALFAWTRQHIQPPPPQLPVVDDHVWHIIIRGYGQSDQMADVFTTLATYAGIPAFWEVVKLQEHGRLVLSFTKIDDRWAVFDVARGLVFADPHGRLIDVRELAAHPELADAVTRDTAPTGIPYRRYLERLHAFQAPAVLRAEKQMPLQRLAFELRRLCHLTTDAEAMPGSKGGADHKGRP